MTDSSTPEGTGLTEAQAAERFEAMLTRQEQGTGETETGAEEAQTEAEDEPDEESEGAEAEEQDDDGEEPDEDPEQPQTYRVKVDGEEVEVTLDELQKGYSREATFTRKTQALAQERHALEAEKASLAPEREQYRAVLDAWEKQLAQPPHNDEALDYLRSNDPASYAAAVADNQRHKDGLTAIQAEKTRINEQASKDANSKRAEAIHEAETALVAAVPEWKDPQKLSSGLKAAFDYAATFGITPDKVFEGADAETIKMQILILKEAAAYRAIQSKKPAVQQKVQAVKTATPGAQQRTPAASKVTELTRSKQRLAKTGRVDDAAAIFLKMLPD